MGTRFFIKVNRLEKPSLSAESVSVVLCQRQEVAHDHLWPHRLQMKCASNLGWVLTFSGLRVRPPASRCAHLICATVSLWLANCSTLFNLLKQLLALIRTAGVGHVPLLVAVRRRRQNQFHIIGIENRNLRRAIPLFFIWLIERIKCALQVSVWKQSHNVCINRWKVPQHINYAAVFRMRRGKFNISFLMSRCVAFKARACFPPPLSATV